MNNRKVAIYTSLISITGIILLIAITVYYGIKDIPGVLFLAVLGIVAESMAVSIGSERGLSVGFAITLCAMLTYGPAGGAWVSALSALLKVIYIKNKGYLHLLNTPFYKTLFNAANYIISSFVAMQAFYMTGGTDIHVGYGELSAVPLLFREEALPISVMILVFLLVNSGLLAVLFGMISGQRTVIQWFKNFKWIIANIFAVGSIGIIITIAYQIYGYFAVILFYGPLILARYSFKMFVEMRNVYLETVKALAAAIEAKDKYTLGHSRRVEKYSCMIAEEMKLPDSRIETLRYAALLHDIGKIGIHEDILNKPGKLSENEYEIIKQHPDIGCKILEDVDFLKKAKDIIRYHHEWYNGMGYPSHSAGENIPIESLIMAVADAYDAMTTDRPYRKALPHAKAVEIIKSQSGKQFAPTVVDAFERIMLKNGEILNNVV